MDILVQIAQEIDIKACCTSFCKDAKKFNLMLPCCGYTLHNGLVVIAIFDVVSIIDIKAFLSVINALSFCSHFEMISRSELC